ncbi:MAG: DUF1656 domain-containing protein [Commensalibacter sp.]|nr:DUF1656 domain-containing protein [Commensalibacter sp.]
MIAEFDLFGVFIAPFVVYALIALIITMIIRSILWRTGLIKLFWHLALFEVALYVCVLCLLILYA